MFTYKIITGLGDYILTASSEMEAKIKFSQEHPSEKIRKIKLLEDKVNQ